MSLINKLSKFFKKKKGIVNPGIEGRVYIGKFVNQNGSDIGESVAFEKERIIVKNSDVFMSIPLEKVMANNQKIIVGDFNSDESLRLGREWIEKKDTLKFDSDGMLIK